MESWNWSFSFLDEFKVFEKGTARSGGRAFAHVEKFTAATLAEKLFAGHALHGKSPGNNL